MPPPPRKVVLEKYPALPPLPRDIIIERWLDYPDRKRNVVFQRAPPQPPLQPQKNLIIEWQTPQLNVKRNINISYTTANPQEYNNKYSSTFVQSEQIPSYVKKFRPENGQRLAADGYKERIRLVGDVDALRLLPNKIPINASESDKKHLSVSFGDSTVISTNSDTLFKENFILNHQNIAHRDYY